MFVCIFRRINLAACNAFRRSLLAARLFYLQIPNTEKGNIIQSPAFCFVCCTVRLTLLVCKCVFDSVSVCLTLSASVRLCFFVRSLTHGLRFISSKEEEVACSPHSSIFLLCCPSCTIHIQKYTIFFVIEVTIMQECAIFNILYHYYFLVMAEFLALHLLVQFIKLYFTYIIFV